MLSGTFTLARFSFRGTFLKVPSSSFGRIASSSPISFDKDDVGKMYEVPMDDCEIVFNRSGLHKGLKSQIKTMNECFLLFREQSFEAFEALRQFGSLREDPASRLVLWGQFGTGKTLTMHQLVHLALCQDYILFVVRDALEWTRDHYRETQLSTYKQGRVNSPYWAGKLLTAFKSFNQRNWQRFSELRTTKDYQWSQIERTPKGRSLTEIVEMGISAPFLATDCVGALCRELRIHATAGHLKLLVAIDKANALYGRAFVRKPDRQIAKTEELALTQHFRKFLMPIWSNGLVALVADKAEVSIGRDLLSVPPNDPRTLFGNEGYDQIDPFISLQTKLYTEQEIANLSDYYLQRNWMHQAEGPSGNEAKKQLMHLSALNPLYYERICAMSWKLSCVPPNN